MATMSMMAHISPATPALMLHDGTSGEIEHFHPCRVVAGRQEPVRSQTQCAIGA